MPIHHNEYSTELAPRQEPIPRAGQHAALRRLPRPETIADSKNWQRLGGEPDTWLIGSSTKVGINYEVDGRCACSDYAFNRPPGGSCKHRIARALANRATEILRNKNGAGGEGGTPAPDSMGTTMKFEEYSTTDLKEGQVKRST